MAYCRLVFPLLVLSVVNCYASVAPVYMWGDLPQHLSEANPLTTLNEEEFAQILKEETAESLVVVFAEQTLSVEDFSRRDDDGLPSFNYLHSKIGSAAYLPSVANPLEVLKTFADGSETTIDLTNAVSSDDISVKSSDKFVIINLKDALEDESRTAYLRRHDEFMQNTVSKLQENGVKVVAIYTAYSPSWIIPVSHSRARRAASRNDFIDLIGLRLHAKSISLKSRNETIPLTPLVSSNTTFDTDVMNTTLVYENDTSIMLNFVMKGGYWYFDSVTLSLSTFLENLYPVEEVFAIEGFSYRCAENVRFASVNDTRDYTLNFENLKIQPFFENTNSSTPFGDSFNCVGFFSAPIWAGLFVTFILLAITFYGIMMMMDIRTMDRFDDPKGKTITINAGE
ncbi:unnamed protein product [Arctia plantaginis]|uniref:V-type proton ATPase subunit S1 n=1 Tax=Arctia plantaginis TaxID=874455 RepID=A0A8S1BN85_ARCPL|nr:unnamed protein product [Arctia plantaginis]